MESQCRTVVVTLPIAIPVSPVTPFKVTTAVLVKGNLMIQPLVAGRVGGVIVFAPEAKTSTWMTGLAAAEAILKGPIILSPVRDPRTAPEIDIEAVAAKRRSPLSKKE